MIKIQNLQFLFKGNFRESQRELQKWFARQPQEHLGNQQILEDAENELEGDKIVDNREARQVPYMENTPTSATLDDVKIRMLHTDDTTSSIPAMQAANNQKISSISGASNIDDQRYYGT